MANQPKTPARTFRIPDPLWEKVKQEADTKGTTSTAVVVAALEKHLTV